jgi:hypothetical protein
LPKEKFYAQHGQIFDSLDFIKNDYPRNRETIRQGKPFVMDALSLSNGVALSWQVPSKAS